jgi:lipoprotein NlpD
MPSPALSLTAAPCRVCLAFVAIALIVSGCASRRPAPVEDRALARSQPPQVTAPGRASSTVPTEPPPPVTYTVKRGDTLHQIALDSGLDYRELAAWNNIENVNRIFPGQVLRLGPPGENPPATTAPVIAGASQPDPASGVVIAPLRTVPAIGDGRPASGDAGRIANAPPSAAAIAPSVVAPASPAASGTLKTSPKAIKEPYSEHAVRELNLAASAGPAPADALPIAPPVAAATSQSSAPPNSVQAAASPPAAAITAPPAASRSAPAPSTAGDGDQLDWAWPAKGRIVAGFSETANLKGIDIAGTAGEAVRASAAGRVVYAGAGLRGYGKLIIIKHNATYLSAYAHNREILVKEGQQVTRGQKIAEMGNTDADQVKLHFEIRRLGKPMDPTKYLPPA